MEWAVRNYGPLISASEILQVAIVVSQPLLGLEGGFYMSCSPCKASLDSLQEFTIAGEVLISMIAGLQ